MKLGRLRIIGFVVLLLFAVQAAQARFASPTTCTGQMAFANDDGTSEAYALDLRLSSDGYLITSTNIQTGEVTRDAGDCTRYISGTCRHRIVVDGAPTGDYYSFALQPVTDVSFSYTETWKDGSVGRTVLTCRTD
ncbi:hypothetical protein ACERZ8_14075 [Tateyamaria armeniaca]|uniref:Uncharacterized protein n=1 Tax=Tateyamaria armeniaca TaxID=2518930 RepID=A0ABW8UYF4_9RHOB